MRHTQLVNYTLYQIGWFACVLGQSFAEALRLELQPLGVDVIASAPGPIRSGFAARASMTMGLAQTPRDVAGATLASLGHRGTVRPGWLSKSLEASLMFLPRWGRVRMMGIVMAGMTKPQAVPGGGFSREGRR